jgi:hypothetical protein
VEGGVLRTYCSVGTEFKEILGKVVDFTNHDDKEQAQHDEVSESEPYNTDNADNHKDTVVTWQEPSAGPRRGNVALEPEYWAYIPGSKLSNGLPLFLSPYQIGVNRVPWFNYTRYCINIPSTSETQAHLRV